jgi:hypothetical protein
LLKDDHIGAGWCSFVHTPYRVAGISTQHQPVFPLQAKPSCGMAVIYFYINENRIYWKSPSCKCPPSRVAPSFTSSKPASRTLDGCTTSRACAIVRVRDTGISTPASGHEENTCKGKRGRV